MGSGSACSSGRRDPCFTPSMRDSKFLHASSGAFTPDWKHAVALVSDRQLGFVSATDWEPHSAWKRSNCWVT